MGTRAPVAVAVRNRGGRSRTKSAQCIVVHARGALLPRASRDMPEPPAAPALSSAAAAPAIVLVRPQLAENIGAVARAMLNFGLTELRLVSPRGRWPDEVAYRSASGADVVLDTARVHATTAAAVADLSLVYASTARLRDMIKPASAPRAAARELREAAAAGARTGILFGPERTGLDND